MNNYYDDFREKFQIDALTIFETEYWCWSLRQAQVTIGSGILSLKRPEVQFSQISDKESTDLINIVRVIESTLTKTFSYKQINYLMLMMVDFHVHYHVIPRYNKDVYYSGMYWKDENYPKLPMISGIPSDLGLLSEIVKSLKENL